jgi:hypothetical protein
VSPLIIGIRATKIGGDATHSMGDGVQQCNEASVGGYAAGWAWCGDQFREKASSTSRGDRSVMLRRQDDGGAMPLKPTTAMATNFM